MNMQIFEHKFHADKAKNAGTQAYIQCLHM